MFAWNLMSLLWILVAAFFAGVGWTFGCWLVGRVLR